MQQGQVVEGRWVCVPQEDHIECQGLCPPDGGRCIRDWILTHYFLFFLERFHKPDHARQFLTYLNQQHPNIKFTIEEENAGSLSFLDTVITLQSGSFSCGIFRKNTFTGLGSSFYSNIYHNFKLNSIRTLIHRAFNLTSSFFLFHKEVDFLRTFFSNNGFPSDIFDSTLNKFLNAIYTPKLPVTTVSRMPFYFKLPFYNEHSTTVINSLVKDLSSIYPQVQFTPSLSNPFTVGSLFRFKDSIPSNLRSGLVYKYSCGGCNATYIGCTRQRFGARVHQHLGRSDRTGNHLATPSHSEPRNHSYDCNNSPFNSSNFTILDYSQDNLYSLESMYIKRQNPSLNNQTSSTYLYIT